MRQLFLDNKFFALKEVCRPLLDDYSVLVTVLYSFMSSGSEITKLVEHNNAHFFKNIPTKVKKIFDLVVHQGGVHTKRVIQDRLAGKIVPIGQSCSGRVIAVGSKVKRFNVGDFVACAGEGLANHAEIVCVPEHLVVHVQQENLLKPASLTGIGTIAMQSVRRAQLALGETVCIVGLDTIGQLVVQLAYASGCRVIAVDMHEKKVEHAKRIGAEYAHTADSHHLQESIDYVTYSYGVDCTIVTPEWVHDDGINFAANITRKKGRLILAANNSFIVKQERIQQKELDVLFSLAYGPGRYDADYEYQGRDYPYAYVRWTENRNMYAFMHLLETNKLAVDYLLAHEIMFDDLSKELPDTRNSLGILIRYAKQDENLFTACAPGVKTQDAYIPARKDPAQKMQVTFFGASRATRLSLLPILRNIKSVTIHKIIDRDISKALNAAKTYTGAVALSGDPELFYDDPTTDVVMVTSCTHLHVEHVIKALRNGKFVYLHKTLPMNLDIQKRLYDYLRSNEQARLCMGYYRTAAPFIQKIKQVLTHRKSPLMINYRLNLGGIEDAETADMRPRHGNVIDKASHTFDLFYYLVEAQPLAVSVEVLHPTRENIYATDNFVAQISFSDGSLCSLQFTSLGHYDAGIERMEVHFDGKTIVMDDFVRLNGFGLPHAFDEIVRVPDKGREAYIRRFFNEVVLQERSPLFDINKFDVVSSLTMHIDHLVCQGGGEIKKETSVV